MKHPTGCHRIDGRTYFILYAPYAKQVRLAFFARCEDGEPEAAFPMRAIGGGYWEYSDIQDFAGRYYAFRPDDGKDYVADPYARSVSTFNDHLQNARAYIPKDDYDWEGDDFVKTADPRDLIIYECHVRDLTAHPESGAKHGGTYAGVEEKIDYLLELGVNAVEFLPLMHFANYEPPKNGWNPYAYNHWGYMTSFFFAPANFYARAGTKEFGTWSDPRGAEIDELRSLVKALHKAKISVIMDVVYNHISQYNINPLRQLAEDQYLRLYENMSGCGNDTRSESPVMSQLIVDSVVYWMKEFHIDGFRLDMAGVLDDPVLLAIRQAAVAVNPDVVLAGEPWGRRYFPEHMSDMGFGVWNDTYRNGIKGENPADRQGFLFGKWEKDLHRNNFVRLLTGSLRKDGGLVPSSKYSVNYIASHDGYTLGDFIRISLREKDKTVLPDRDEHIRLGAEEQTLHRIAAFMLFCSQGMLMMHAGQEYARSKVIVPVKGVRDPHAGELDFDSYAKDNETNYMDFRDRDINRGLFDYYRQLIALRKAFPELRSADPGRIAAIYAENCEFGLGYTVRSEKRRCAVLVNTSPENNAAFDLGEGEWQVHATLEKAACDPIRSHPDPRIVLRPRSVCLLVKPLGPVSS